MRLLINRASLLAGAALCGLVPTTAGFTQDISAPAGQAAQPDSSASSQPAANATAAPAATPAPAEIVVTGTLFRRTDRETPSPVTVLSADKLKNAGITNVADAVRSISADNSGSIPTSFTNGFGAGSAAVSLRGLSVNSTLTLIDGMRTADYALSDDGERSFVDLNTISDATIDRIEVLKDGASSTYGADAIGGVVNIITKKEIQGVYGTVEGGISQHKDGGEQRIQLTAGFGDLDTNNYNVYFSGEYEHDSAIYNKNRGYPYNTNNLTAIGGDDNNAGSAVPGATTSAVVAPTISTGGILGGTGSLLGNWQVLNPAGCGTGTTAVSSTDGSGCEENTAEQYGEIQPSQTRLGLSMHSVFNVSDNAQAYFNLSYNQNKVTAEGTPASIREANPVDTLNIVLPAVLSNGSLNPNDPFAAEGYDARIYYRFGDIPASSTYFNHVIHVATGVSGTFGDGWSYGVDASGAHTWLNITQRGYLNIAQLEEDIEDGAYNFVDPSENSAAVRSALSPNVDTTATSDLGMIQGHIAKGLMTLPGGTLQLAVGGSVRYEDQDDPNQNADEATLDLNSYSAIGSQWVESGYFELDAPVLKQLDINASGRYDHYSEGYDHFSPKIGVKFTPIRQLALRGTFSKGFRAPSFAETHGSVIGYTTTSLPCSAQETHGATATADGGCSGGSAYNQSYSLGLNTAGNPNLKPELSRSFTGGAVIQPTRWLSFTADYYNIKKTHVIVAGPLSNVALADYYAGTALPAGYSVTLDSADTSYPDGTRRVLYVNSPYANAAGLKTDGLDLEVQAVNKLGDDLKLTSSAEFTDIFHYKFKAAEDEPYVEYVGTQAPYNTSSGAGTPKWRGNWQESLEYKKATLSATAYYTAGYRAVGYDAYGVLPDSCVYDGVYGGSNPYFNCRVKRFIDVDLTGSYKLNDGMTVYFNIVNLLNAKAPLDAGNYAAVNYNPTYTQAGAVGRYFRIGATFKL